jgi:hypothetical protein
MNSKHLKPLTEKYKLIQEQVAGAGEVSTGGSTYSPENMVEIVPVALSWKDIGLFEPNDEEETKETEKAIEEVEKLFDGFQKDLDAWQKKHKDLGALDTVAKEQIAQFVAKNLFGLTKLD